MNEAFIQHAEHDVDRDQRSQNQQRLIGQRILEGGRGPLEIRLQAGREVNVAGNLVDCLDGIAQRRVRAQIEGDSDRGKLSLMIDGERFGCRLQMGEGIQRYRIRGR